MLNRLNRVILKEEEPRAANNGPMPEGRKFKETELEIFGGEVSPVQFIQLVKWVPSTEMKVDFLQPEADSNDAKASDREGNEVFRPFVSRISDELPNDINHEVRNQMQPFPRALSCPDLNG